MAIIKCASCAFKATAVAADPSLTWQCAVFRLVFGLWFCCVAVLEMRVFAAAEARMMECHTLKQENSTNSDPM